MSSAGTHAGQCSCWEWGHGHMMWKARSLRLWLFAADSPQSCHCPYHHQLNHAIISHHARKWHSSLLHEGMVPASTLCQWISEHSITHDYMHNHCDCNWDVWCVSFLTVTGCPRTEAEKRQSIKLQGRTKELVGWLVGWCYLIKFVQQTGISASLHEDDWMRRK